MWVPNYPSTAQSSALNSDKIQILHSCEVDASIVTGFLAFVVQLSMLQMVEVSIVGAHSIHTNRSVLGGTSRFFRFTIELILTSVSFLHDISPLYPVFLNSMDNTFILRLALIIAQVGMNDIPVCKVSNNYFSTCMHW